ncbi:hypothetical protein MYAM1_000170 [Malassezia yamatoensis]|uniref:Uncharacterized protein n=1 Tax=Malassezia yamatoensis TaxID=253288 RepID=A0AAJ5YP12_9BASI|nr:hypothetical protein MYAM1_000170 [Malassezia yamatoensis]
MRMITSKHTPEVAAQVPPVSTNQPSTPASSLPTSGMSPRSPQELSHSTAMPVGQAPRIPHVTASEANRGRPQRPSKHRLVYSEIFGPMAWVLAYSTATYFALALVWNLLARSEEQSGQNQQISSLQRQIRAAVGNKEI